MVNDVIKQIILKFKTEGTTGVNKEVANLSKAFNTKEIDNFQKSIKDLKNAFDPKQFQGATKLSQTFKEINDKHLVKLKSELKAIDKLMESQLTNLSKLEKGKGDLVEIEKSRTA